MNYLDKTVEINHENHEIYFEIDCNYTYDVNSGEIEYPRFTRFGLNLDDSYITREGAPITKKWTRNTLILHAWNKYKERVESVMFDRLERYVEENEAEILEELRDFHNDY